MNACGGTIAHLQRLHRHFTDASVLDEWGQKQTTFAVMENGKMYEEYRIGEITMSDRTEFISRQAAIDVLEERLQANGYSNVALVSELNRSIGYLMGLPSVDAVPVVRCKDCRWYKTNYMWNGTEVKICAKEAYEPRRNADDFCSNGERK